MNVTVAGPAELETVIDILEDAARWQVERGIKQWEIDLFAVRLRELLARQISEGIVYVASIDGQAVGTLTLMHADPGIWDDETGDARYLHRFAVRRSLSGQGIGRELLRWAEAETVRQGCTFLRLDTVYSNEPLIRYYVNAGFERLGDRDVFWGRACLFEKRVGAAG